MIILNSKEIKSKIQNIFRQFNLDKLLLNYLINPIQKNDKKKINNIIILYLIRILYYEFTKYKN